MSDDEKKALAVGFGAVLITSFIALLIFAVVRIIGAYTSDNIKDLIVWCSVLILLGRIGGGK